VEEEKQWDPGGHVNLYTKVISSPFNLCNQGKLVLAVKFYNLEDKVGLEGVDIVMSKPIANVRPNIAIFQPK
jgi:hypothetical protein